MYIINTIPHGKCFVQYLRTRCFCIRNLTRSLRSLVRFLIRQQLVRKYRTPALSMKYSLYIIMLSRLYVILILYKVTLIMVIDVFSLKSYTWFPFEITLWFRTKLHDTQFNYHFITTILKSQNSSSQYQYLFDLVASLLKSGNKGLIHLILYPKQKWCNRGRKWCAI